LPFVPIVAVAVVLALSWEALPALFPIHWNGRMEADGWATRTVVAVFGWLAFGLVLTAMMGLCGYGIAHGSRRRHTAGPAAVAEAMRLRLTLRALLAAEWAVAILTSAVGLLPLAHAAGKSDLLAWIVVVAALGFAVGVPVCLGIAAWRRRGETFDDGTRDEAWKAGLFYYDPADPAVFVEKRLGVGYTFNFARPASWVALAALLGAPLLVVWAILRFG
jgi:uncharacterized membrane protein